MLIYILLFLLALFLYALSSLSRNTLLKRLFLLIFFAAFTCLPGLRYEIGGSDYFIYEQAYDIIPYIKYIVKFEPGYNLIMLLSNGLGLTYNQFLFAVTFLSSLLLFYAIDKNTNSNINYMFIGLIVYLAKLYIFYNFVLTRQMIAIPIVWLALYHLREDHKRKYFGLIFLAFLFHYSALIFFLLYFVYKKNWTSKRVVLIISATVILTFIKLLFFRSFISYIPYFGEKLSFYLSFGDTINPLNLIETFGLLTICTYYKKELSRHVNNYNFYYNLLVVFTLILILFYDISVFKRIRDYFILSYLLSIPAIIAISKKGLSQVLVTFLIISYFFLLYARSIMVFDTTTGGVGNLVPYKYILF